MRRIDQGWFAKDRIDMHSLEIHNFGPIKNAHISVSRFLVLIGPQSSGKSTIAKLIYFFLHLRDEVTAFVLETAESGKTANSKRDLGKKLRNRFVEFFGPTPQSLDVKIEYHYSQQNFIVVSLDKEHHKYTNIVFSPAMWSQISALILEVDKEVRSRPTKPGFGSAITKISAGHDRSILLDKIRTKCNKIFAFDKELFFIPAGRSMLSTLSDQIQYIHPHQLDYPMRQFVEAVNGSRAFFAKSMNEIVKERTALTTEKLFFGAIRKAQGYVKKILNGEYRYDKEGGKIYLSDSTYTKMSYASSGQQEAVWILLSLFLVVLDKMESLVFVEEPEAHLFPSAQKDVIEYIVFILNEIGCDFVLTTHSPYILSSINNLTYAYELGSRGKNEDVQAVIPKEQWLDPSVVGGYFVNQGQAATLLTEGSSELQAELLDSASEEVNAQFESLLEIERSLSKNAK